MNKTLSLVVVGLAVVMIIILGLVFYVILTDTLSDDTVAVASVTPTETTVVATATKMPALPTTGVEVLPTVTDQPTSTPTETPEPSQTPLPTDTPVPPTNTPPPVVILPTNTPPPPTNTPEPTSPPSTNGLILEYFRLQPRSVYAVNQPVWFEFSIENVAGGPVPFGALGVMPKKDGTDRLDWYQHSWGGNNDAIPVNGLSWEDNIKLPESGSYTLRLVICFQGYSTCLAGQGNWITLSQEIPVNIS